MKIVLATGFDSFERSIPNQLAEEFIRLTGGNPTWYELDSTDENIDGWNYRRVDTVTQTPSFYFELLKKDVGKVITNYEEYFDAAGSEYAVYFDANQYRTDPLFIQLVEKYNPQTLKVIEIPDEVKYWIRDNEMGGEYIAEQHRTWS